MVTHARWRDALALALGAALIVSPLGFDFIGDPRSAWHALGAGAALFALGAAALNQHRTWEEAALLLLGVWLLAAPFLLHFANAAATWTHLATGTVLVADVLWTLAADFRTAAPHRPA
jgi:hypothetical protein